MSKHTSSVRNKVKLMKLRNLAMHIVNYSCNPDLNKSAIELKTIQTVMNIADSDDSETASNCMVAISNISSSENVRSLLFELNAIHKVCICLYVCICMYVYALNGVKLLNDVYLSINSYVCMCMDAFMVE
jgi:hypothetical protein